MMGSRGALGEGQGRPFPGKWAGHPDLLSLARGQLWTSRPGHWCLPAPHRSCLRADPVFTEMPQGPCPPLPPCQLFPWAPLCLCHSLLGPGLGLPLYLANPST